LLLVLPSVWILQSRSNTKIERAFVLLVNCYIVVFWLFNALSVERVYWLAFAVVLGMAHRHMSPTTTHSGLRSSN
jgi:hypothetical protein